MAFNIVLGTRFSETVYGTDLDDWIAAGAGEDIIYGGSGNDEIYGDAPDPSHAATTMDADQIAAGDGDDRIHADFADTYIDGGNGRDWLLLDVNHLLRTAQNIPHYDTYVDLTHGYATTDYGSMYVLNIEDVSTGFGDDTVVGSNGSNRIDVAGGDDVVMGRRGHDQLFGLDGNDFLNGGAGYDSIEGGRGDDTLLGGGGGDRLYGHDGDDVLAGGNGRDQVFGNRGSDLLLAGRFAFVPEIGVGGNFGQDGVWKGGAGTDTFRFGQGWGDIVIRDFQNGRDVIDLTELGLTSTRDLTIADAYRGNPTIPLFQRPDSVLISHDGNSIALLHTSSADISDADFLF